MLLRGQILSPLALGLFDVDLYAMSVRPGILTDTGNLP
jgi:hypothetical protein